jgi:hypothetical protein
LNSPLALLNCLSTFYTITGKQAIEYALRLYGSAGFQRDREEQRNSNESEQRYLTA